MIKGISSIRRFNRLGKIRLGEKRKNDSGKEYPAALEHFNFTDAPDLVALYGENCKEIDIMLPNENIDAFFPQMRKAYRASGLFCQGDGETATRVNVGLSDGDKNAKNVPKGKPLDADGMAYIQAHGIKAGVGDLFELPCLGEDCPFTLNKFCKPIGRLLFLVPKSPRIGVYEISTTSFNSIVSLNSMIDTIKTLAGRVSMIPLKLRLVPKETKVPKTNMKKTIHHLVLEFTGSIADLSQYRNAKQIPMEALPTRHELEQHIPDDLVPHGGNALDEHLAGGPEPIPGPDESPETGSAEIAVSDVKKQGGNYLVLSGKDTYKTKDEATARMAKARIGKGPIIVDWKRDEAGVLWIETAAEVQEKAEKF